MGYPLGSSSLRGSLYLFPINFHLFIYHLLSVASFFESTWTRTQERNDPCLLLRKAPTQYQMLHILLVFSLLFPKDSISWVSGSKAWLHIHICGRVLTGCLCLPLPKTLMAWGPGIGLKSSQVLSTGKPEDHWPNTC